MSKLTENILSWNTPIIGSYLLWRFTKGYTEEHDFGESPDIILHFIAIAILTDQLLSRPINNYKKDLLSYVRSFEKEKDIDLLFKIQDKIDNKKKYTLTAIDLAIQAGLILWDIESGKIHYYKIADKKLKSLAIKKTHSDNGKKAEILGKWFAHHDVETIVSYLKVVL